MYIYYRGNDSAIQEYIDSLMLEDYLQLLPSEELSDEDYDDLLIDILQGVDIYQNGDNYNVVPKELGNEGIDVYMTIKDTRISKIVMIIMPDNIESDTAVQMRAEVNIRNANKIVMPDDTDYERVDTVEQLAVKLLPFIYTLGVVL